MWPPVERKQQVGECWVCVILFPRLVMRGGVTGGGDSPPMYIVSGTTGGSQGGRQYPGKNLLVLIFRWADPPMVFCMGLHMVLGHDGFRPLVFCRSGQGNYDYVLI